ncbi:hypothetical protein DFH08DRAFT_809251 [Mycena albidolilacea]|uniref:Uncharacterized protein n=1 Tax=Mycena albidolilacea TaxID=1033008 RepID=A0AAD7ER22_9AGAR|nr:hypothetical protein DFH08DRAFT_809251 [Mycena albidolilacea]
MPNIQTLIFLSFKCILLLPAAKGCCERICTVNNLRLSSDAATCLQTAAPKVKQLSIWDVVELDPTRISYEFVGVRPSGTTSELFALFIPEPGVPRHARNAAMIEFGGFILDLEAENKAGYADGKG